MSETHDFSLVEIPSCGHDVTAKAVPQVRQAIVDFCMGLNEGGDEEE